MKLLSYLFVSASIAISHVNGGPQIVQPNQIIQLDKSGGGGITTNPNIQNKNAVYSLEMTFPLPDISYERSCRLSLDLQGHNSESDWMAFVPDATAKINVFALFTPASPGDTYTHHPQKGQQLATMLVSTKSAGGIDVKFVPDSFPCAKAVDGLMFEPTSSTIILGWEQPGKASKGLQLLMD